MSLFPVLQPARAPAGELPLYREAAWDFQTGAPVFRGGAPVVVTGKDAVLVWAWKALRTVRFRHPVYSWSYGCELERLVGRPYTQALKQAEAARYVRECLLINPYIKGAGQVQVSFAGDTLAVLGRLETVYGEEEISLAV